MAGLLGWLALLLLLTWGGERWQMARMAARLPLHQDALTSAALARIEADFQQLQADLRAEAQALAEAPAVRVGLRERSRGAEAVAQDTIFRFIASYPVPERGAVEVYDAARQVVAWNGFSMPRDPVGEQPDGPRMGQTAVVNDGPYRQALVVWWPIQENGQLMGMVRVLRLSRIAVPVRNRYLRPWSLEEQWTRAVGWPVQVSLGPDDERPDTLAGQQQLLQGLDGTVLGRVVVALPEGAQVLQAGQQRFRDVAAFWQVLLIGVGLFGLWRSYRAVDAPEAPVKPLFVRFVLLLVAGVGARYALLELGVPGRWQTGKAPLAPLFDVRHLASDVGGGVLRSIGDLLVTAVFALLLALAFLHLVQRLFLRWQRSAPVVRHGAGVVVACWMACATGGMALLGALAYGIHHAVFDSTLAYFAGTHLLPPRLVVLVCCGLLVLTVAVLLVLTGLVRLAYRVARRHADATDRSRWALWGGLALVPPLALYAGLGWWGWMPWWVALLFAGISLGLAAAPGWPHGERRWPTLRNVLLATFVLAFLQYPLLYQGFDARRRLDMQEAASLFQEGRDPGLLHAIRQQLMAVQEDSTVVALLQGSRQDTQVLDSLAAALLRPSLLASLGDYDKGLTLLDQQGRVAGRSDEGVRQRTRTMLDTADSLTLDLLRQIFAGQDPAQPQVEKLTGDREHDQFQYAGFVSLGPDGQAGWAFIRAVPETYLRERNTPFPEVLIPESFYGNLYSNRAMAEFRNGRLVRSLGGTFGRYQLEAEVARALTVRPSLWRTEAVKDQQYLTYYQRQQDGTGLDQPALPTETPAIIAVRVKSLSTFDHLYYLLRLMFSGLVIGLPFYLVGLLLRWRAQRLPAPRQHFRDKVLNAFFFVGIITVVTMGAAGLQVVTSENERAVQSWLRQHLERVEEALLLEAQGDELPYRVLERTPLDSLALRVGLDLNLYEEARLVATSRPQLVRERLIDERLPIGVYTAFYLDGYRFISSEERTGTFRYTAGYRVLADEEGQPRYVLALPTLPEQERLEEERARTLAYLFGALLLLVLLVLLTAGLLANTLTRPIARLREGLAAVARGHFEQIPPVRSRDEIAELVETFNDMQGQLVESRWKLAQQERQLAWQEMARQVAHEIKNPLTPMKLSVQHLQRAYESLPPHPEASLQRFGGLFARITTTLIEQIDTLARIANEFSSFARLPQRHVEPLDLNAVVQEAAMLMQEEVGTELMLRLHPEPLVLQADREELRRIYINLLKNAHQAVPTGRLPQVRVETRWEAGAEGHPGWACSAVADNGTGIPEDIRDRIFTPSFSTKTSGTGLGLALARKSVEDLQGEIGFETTEGIGTTFWIRLPLAR
jgi:signal transduction histidine kinase